MAEETTELADNATPEMVKFIVDEWDKLRTDYMRRTIWGALVYGWQPSEIVYNLEEEDGLIHIAKIKSLLQDLSFIIIDVNNGDFEGIFQQRNVSGGLTGILPQEASGGFTGTTPYTVTIPLPKGILFNWAQEGDDYYGLSLLESIRNINTQWEDTLEAMSMYAVLKSGKLAMIRYPQRGDYVEIDGQEYDPLGAASIMMQRLRANGYLALPSETSGGDNGLTGEWGFEIINMAGAAADYTSMLGHQEKLIVRGLLQPERSLLEGKHGTKADSSIHTDISISNTSYIHKLFIEHVNKAIVEPLLVTNWGPEFQHAVKLMPSPLTDSQVSWLRDLYKSLIVNTAVMKEAIDIDALMDHVGMPKNENVVDIEVEDMNISENENGDDDRQETGQGAGPQVSSSDAGRVAVSEE
jgi:hypothetical protein